METLIALPFVAYVGERLAEKIIKPFVRALSPSLPNVPQEIKDYVESLVCAVPGFAISLLAGLDLFEAVGVPLNPPGGVIVTALVCGFGANLVHEILGYLDELRAKARA